MLAGLEDRLPLGRFAKGQFWRPRHSVSFIRMGPELAATDLWTHSIRAGMKAERKVPKELPFPSSWDRGLSGKWVQSWTLERQPKREDTKPFLRAIRDRVAKVALKQTQHENQSEERIKAGRK